MVGFAVFYKKKKLRLQLSDGALVIGNMGKAGLFV
jgi:hypothetical protein